MGAQSALLRLNSGDPVLMQLIGKMRGARRAITGGEAYRTRSAPPWHIADTWDSSRLSDASSAQSAKDSEIGGEEAESEPTVGIHN